MNKKNIQNKKLNFTELRKLAKEIKQYTEEEAKNRYKYEDCIERKIWRTTNAQACAF